MEQPRIKSHLEELVSVNNRILLLQGSIGSFFYDFAEWLTHTHHKTVFKLNFNGGDEAFYPSETRNTFSYRDTYQAFPEFLVQFIKEHHIQAIVCLGDTRPYHILAKKLAASLDNVSFWAFEEGYFRPHFITLEKSGVND